MHTYRLPDEGLTHVVKRIYELNIPGPSSFADNRVIPMGTGTITIVLKGSHRVQYVGGIQVMPHNILSGQYFPTFSFDSNAPSLIYGIALKPTATHKLFGMYLAELKNDFIRLDEVIGGEAEQVRQNLLQAKSTNERLALLNDWLLDITPGDCQYTYLDKVVDFIYQKKGMLKVKDLCKHTEVSRRYLEKRFKKVIGFTPGQFLRQVRFNFTCTEIAEGSKPVGDILTAFGYFDRSHFMKKFKKFYGDDLSVLTGEKNGLFKEVYQHILRSEAENRYYQKKQE